MSTNLIELFDSSCEKYGNNMCIKYVDEERTTSLTYSDVNCCVEEFCRSLPTNDAANEFVGIVADELNAEVVIIVLGVMKLRNAFVFLDTNSTVDTIWDRIQRLDISHVVISSRSVTPKLSTNFNTISTVQICDEGYEVWRRKKRKHRDTNKIDFAFAMFSSGSTNDRPKIIRVPHSCIIPNVLDLRQIYELQPTDTILVLTPLTFDPSILDLFLALSTGSCVLLAQKRVKFNARVFEEYFSPSGFNVTVFCTTPSIFLQFFPRDARRISLRVLALGGEAFPRLNLDVWPCLENIRVYNIYGITEVSCWASIHLVNDFEDCANLGSCLTDTIFEVKNQDQRVEDGIGQLFIGSHTRFCLVDGETDFPQRPVFRASGDLVRVKNNQIYYIGRNDRRIKLFGHQIDLSTIEDKISRHRDVKQCHCVFIRNSEKVVCFVEPSASNLTVSGLLKSLDDLPSHMRLCDFIFVDEIPLNRHGKISENACVKIYHERCGPDENREQRFKTLWQKYSQQSSNARIDGAKGFIQCGGTSMSALQFVAELEDSFEIPSNFAAVVLSDKSFADCYDCYMTVDSSRSSSEKPRNVAVVNRSLVENSNCVETANLELLATMCKGVTKTERRIEFNERFEKLRIKWKHDLEKCVDASPTLLIFKTKALIVCGSHSGHLITVDIESGNVISKIRLPDRIESSPCVSTDGCSIFIGCYDKNVYRVDINRAEILWRFQTGDIVKSTAVLHDGNLYFGSYDRHFYCISSADGLLIWKNEIDAFPIYTTAIVRRSHIVVTTLGGTVALLGHNGVCKVKIATEKPFFSNPTELSHLNAFVSIDVSGVVRLFDINSLAELWRHRVEGNVFSSVTVAADTSSCRIFFGCQASNVYCFELSREGAKLRWKTTLSAAVNSTPFFTNVQNGCIVGATVAGCVFVLDAIEGNLRATYAVNDAVFSSPVVYEENILMGSRDNFLYCLKLTVPRSCSYRPRRFVSCRDIESLPFNLVCKFKTDLRNVNQFEFIERVSLARELSEISKSNESEQRQSRVHASSAYKNRDYRP